MPTAESRLKDLGVVLPTPAAPVANYAPWVIAGTTLVISGQLPFGPDGRIAPGHIGKLGLNIFNEAGQEAARVCAVNVLAQAKAALGSLSRIKRCVRLGGYINAGPHFHALPAVMNGASDFMVAVLGETKGRHARTTVGVAELPMDAAIEIEATFEIET